jgi:Na+/H+ antiporter NhaD/arsenite permease-like protein
MVAALLVLWSAGFLSAVIDNIPFVAVCIPIIHDLLPTLGPDSGIMWWALALGACLGGNGTPIGASANVTTIGLSERAGHPITFRQFLRFGVPVSIGTLAVSSAWVVGFLLLGRDNVMVATLAVAAVVFLVIRLLDRRGAAVAPVVSPR